MPMCPQQRTPSNSQDIMSPLEFSNPLTEDPQKCNIDKTQNKDFKIVIVNVKEL